MRQKLSILILLLLYTAAATAQQGQDSEALVQTLISDINTLHGKPKLKAMSELSKIYVSQNELGKGVLLANDAIDLAISLDDEISLAQFRLDRGSLTLDLFNFEQALADFNAVVSYAKESDNKDFLAKALTQLGTYYGIQKRFDLAKQYMFEANEVYKELGNKLDISTNYNNLAVAITGEIKQILQEGYYTYCQMDSKNAKVQSLIERQLDYYHKSKVLVEQENDEYGIAIAKLNLAVSTYCYSGDFPTVIKQLSSAKNTFRKINAENFIFFTLITEAQIHYYEGNFKAATILFEEAYIIAKKFDAAFIYIYLYEYWLPLLIKSNDSDRALEFLYSYYHLKQLEQDQLSQAKSENANVIHQVVGKEQEIASLNYENKLKTQAIAQEKTNSRYQKIIILAAITLVVALAFLLHVRIKSERVIKRHNQLLEKTALTDPLTGLSNRRALNIAVGREVALFKRHKVPFSIALIDIDHFKQVNDTYGHLSGDKVLVKLANIIHSHVREVDHACRWGGEEILIIFPQAQVEEIHTVVNRILTLVKKEQFDNAEQKFSISFTAGIAQFSEKTSWADLCQKADHALYTGKQSGRGKVIIAD